MSELKTDAKKAGIPTSIDVLITDSTVKQLVTYAKANKSDLVVMGSHGLTGWKNYCLEVWLMEFHSKFIVQC